MVAHALPRIADMPTPPVKQTVEGYRRWLESLPPGMLNENTVSITVSPPDGLSPEEYGEWVESLPDSLCPDSRTREHQRYMKYRRLVSRSCTLNNGLIVVTMIFGLFFGILIGTLV